MAPEACLDLYRRLRRVNCRPEIKYFLWALAFLKQYETEDIFAKQFKTTRKTYRKYVFPLVRKIASLHGTVVSMVPTSYTPTYINLWNM